jgi:hypothetical protein
MLKMNKPTNDEEPSSPKTPKSFSSKNGDDDKKK